MGNDNQGAIEPPEFGFDCLYHGYSVDAFSAAASELMNCALPVPAILSQKPGMNVFLGIAALSRCLYS